MCIRDRYVTPLIGMKFNSFVFAYTYSYQSNSVVFDNGGYHQLTLGFDLGCRKDRHEIPGLGEIGKVKMSEISEYCILNKIPLGLIKYFLCLIDIGVSI